MSATDAKSQATPPAEWLAHIACNFASFSHITSGYSPWCVRCPRLIVILNLDDAG
jgi:hypothetical protein